MVKKLLLVAFLVLGSYANEESNTTKKRNMVVNDLINIPFPGGKMFKSGKIKLDDEQKKALALKVQPIMHEKYNPLVQKIFTLEKAMQRGIIKKATTVDGNLKAQLDEIATLKKEAIGYKIEALLNLKTIFTEEQWNIWVNN